MPAKVTAIGAKASEETPVQMIYGKVNDLFSNGVCICISRVGSCSLANASQANDIFQMEFVCA
jgi:hypothetical protein